MNRLRVIGSQLFNFLVVFGLLGSVNGRNTYKWIPLKTGDTIPDNVVPIDEGKYLGRARYFGEILPAEITEGGLAYIPSCNEEIRKQKFQILTTSGKCEWKSFHNITDIDETAVRVGTASNNEPIFVAQQSSEYYVNYIALIYLTRGEISWFTDGDEDLGYDLKYLNCESKNKWIDRSATNIPQNTVSGGKTKDGYDIYVARLKRDCEIVVGQVIPQLKTGTAVTNDGQNIESDNIQVLVGEPWEYTWRLASDGYIPNYAVVSGKDGNEMSYVARFNRTIGHLTYSQALDLQWDYEILVMNHHEKYIKRNL